MGISYYMVNRTRKDIIHVEKYDILVYLKEAYKARGWTPNDEIDFLSDQDLYIYNLVDSENYTIDYPFW
jgi:hypothetical protein